MSYRTFLAAILAAMLLVAGLAISMAPPSETRASVGLSAFQSMADLKSYLERNRFPAVPSGTDLRGGMELFGTEGALAEDVDFSGTNVQVEGVDESDIVKTDGEFIYVANEDGVTLLKAYPPEEMAVVSQIPKEELAQDTAYVWISGMFLLGKRLIVISGGTGGVVILDDVRLADPAVIGPSESRTHVAVFDVEEAENPTLLHAYEVSGTLKASRMTSNHVYVLTQEYIWRGDSHIYPTACKDARCEDFAVGKIYYDPEADGASYYTIVWALDPVGGEYDHISVVTGYASTVYMSHDNLYVTFPKYAGGSRLPWISSGSDHFTSVYKIGVDGRSMWVAAGGEVAGGLLNQFSMDEKGPYLRVVTTTGWMEHNNVYVLDEDLDVVGALEGLAPNEQVYSARFVGNALYLVTFKKVDPFFVIDLSDPTRPEVLGFLKIPGFSQYLHPLSDHYVLGVGLETVEAEQGDFAWFQGLKLSLFDVWDVSKPREVAKYVIGDRGTTSPVLYDHKAFLNIPSRGLIALPVDLVKRVGDPSAPPFEFGEHVWQGVYVISVSPEEGFVLFGTVSHLPEPESGYS